MGKRLLQQCRRHEPASNRCSLHPGKDALLRLAGAQPAGGLGCCGSARLEAAAGAFARAMKQPVRLRKANLADLSLLRDWDTKAHVAAASGADEPYDWKSELPRDVDWREFLIAEIDGDPIGFIQIIDPAVEETHYWGAIEPNLRAIDIWIGHDGNLGRGFGTQMMQLALERCFAVPAVDAILLDPLASNVRAH